MTDSPAQYVRFPPSPELWRVRFRVPDSSRAVDAHKQTQVMSGMGGECPSAPRPEQTSTAAAYVLFQESKALRKITLSSPA
jgi:hypothetical protein